MRMFLLPCLVQHRMMVAMPFREFWLMVLLTGLCSGCANQLLLYPSTEALGAGTAKPMLLGNAPEQIEVIVAQSPGMKQQGHADAYCLAFCGNATRAESIAEDSAGIWGQH